jgi:hypothetical protein
MPLSTLEIKLTAMAVVFGIGAATQGYTFHRACTFCESLKAESNRNIDVHGTGLFHALLVCGVISVVV